MEKDNLNYQVITPMFSYGANKKKPEYRSTELKALMRYTYRMIQQTMQSKDLFLKESEIFGDAKNHASPVGLSIKGNKSVGEMLLVDRGNYPEKSKKSSVLDGISIGSECFITIRMRHQSNALDQKACLNWYKELIELSLLLGGMGKRVRRGRGRIGCIGKEEKGKEEMICYITKKLNQFCEGSDPYQCPDNKRIVVADSREILNPPYPVIEWIEFGKEIFVERSSEGNEINYFLACVDAASHQIKKREKGWKYATGYVDKKIRFASSCLVGLIKIKGGYLPIFTSVKAVYSDCNAEKDEEEKRRYVDLIEQGRMIK